MEPPAQSGGPTALTTRGAVSRRKFMALAGGSAAAAAFMAACGSDSSAAGETSQFGDGDVGILNYALTLEYLQAAFYADAVKSGLFPGNVKRGLARFGEEEEEHAFSLIKAIERLDGEPGAKPETKFSLETEKGTLETASTLENIGAAAYLGQLPHIESNSVLATVLSIHSVEGRHASTIETLLGNPITPDGAFAKPASVNAVLKTVAPYMGEKKQSRASS